LTVYSHAYLSCIIFMKVANEHVGRTQNVRRSAKPPSGIVSRAALALPSGRGRGGRGRCVATTSLPLAEYVPPSNGASPVFGRTGALGRQQESVRTRASAEAVPRFTNRLHVGHFALPPASCRCEKVTREVPPCYTDYMPDCSPSHTARPRRAGHSERRWRRPRYPR
jgi:hypothetical protein